MASIQAPAPELGANLEEGHSLDCRNLDLEYYPDLYEDIKRTISQTREALYEFIDTDLDFVDKLDKLLKYVLSSNYNYKQLVSNVSYIQRIISSSKLTADQKLAIWKPIAECYQRVQIALSERIIPLKKRELLRKGDTVIVPVSIFPLSSGIGAITAFSPFKYALERGTASGGTCRDSLPCLYFSDDYLRNLSPDVLGKFPRHGTVNLPLKIVSVQIGMSTIAEIDEEVFARMYP